MMRHKENPLTFYRTKGGENCDADYADFVVLHERTHWWWLVAVVKVVLGGMIRFDR